MTTTTPPSQREFQADQVATIALGHFTHDSYSAFLAPLLPIIRDRLATNYAMTGGLAIFMQLPSLLNPFIGYLADRVSLRYFIILAPAITATLMSSIGLVSDYYALALLLFAAGISVSAFHSPAPAMIGRVSGRRVGAGMSIFMAAGEAARALGPLAAVAGVSWFGLEGIWRLAVVGWMVSAILYFRLRHVSARPAEQRTANLATIWRKLRRVFVILAWLMLGRVFMQAALTTYLPIFVSDVLGKSLWLSGMSLAILEGAGVVGALATGTLSDRLGRAPVLLTVLGLAPLFLFGFIFGPTWSAVPFLIALGLTSLSAQPVMLALVQDEFPDNRAMANGIFLALSFLLRALGIFFVGAVADGYGLTNAFLFSALVAFVSLPAVFWLPKGR